MLLIVTLLLVILLRISLLLLVVLLRVRLLLTLVVSLLVVSLLLVVLLLLRVNLLLSRAVALCVSLLSRLLIHAELCLLKDLPCAFQTGLSLLDALERVGDETYQLVENLVGVTVGVVLKLSGILTRALHDFGFLLLRLI